MPAKRASVANQPEFSSGNGRRALVIGNAAYTLLPSLLNPGNDAKAMGQALKKLGFAVTVETDLARDQMEDCLLTFYDDLGKPLSEHGPANTEAALLFFAGHGVQVEG